MRNRFQHLRRDEKGIAFIYVGGSFMAFMAATTLAIDVGMLMTARSQAQTAADSGALAGAVALAFNDYADRTTSGPAVVGAKNSAQTNKVVGGVPSVNNSDVTFPLGPTGINNRVQVTVYRTAARSNPVPTFIGRFFGITNADISATATAEAAPANAETCVAPFTIPDKWIEKQTPAWDPNDTFNAFPSNPSQQGDIYHPASGSDYTGYNAVTDKGLQVTLKAGTGTNIAPSFYFPLALPGNTGASDYSAAISGCNSSIMHWNDLMVAEPGNMVGPTKQGVEELIAKDPSAYWDTSKNGVVSTKSPSPRVKVVPIFDPYYWNVGKQNGRTADLKAANFIGFFIEGMSGNNVIGRITPTTGLIDEGSPVPASAVNRAIRLVK